MKIKIIALLCVLSLLTPTYAHAQGGISAADFLPPAKGGTKKVKNRDAVKIKDNVVTAETAQDALNEAMSANIASLSGQKGSGGDLSDIGFKWVEFGSGVGLLATGMGTYTEVPNPNASRLAQRAAYVVAYTNAKATIAQSLSGVTIDDSETIATATRQINTDTAYESATKEELDEMLRQSASLLLKGYVTYSIDEVLDTEDPRVRFVFVSLASTPKTQSLITRQGAMRQVDTMLTGIDDVMEEVQNGLVPPVGGRVITVAETGETAIVGFGSALIQSSPSRALVAKNRLTARKIAEARARSSLFGIIGGDSVLWQTGVNTKTKTEFSDIANYSVDQESGHAAVEEASQALSSAFSDATSTSDAVRSLRRGQLPPGIQSRTWENEDGFWVYSMMVYYPELTDFSAAFAKQMREADLIAPVNDTGIAPKTTRTIDGRVKRLKGGKVSPDDDL